MLQYLQQLSPVEENFQKKVLEAIRAANENKLSNRNLRCDSLLAADWPQKLEQFILQTENSCSVPGDICTMSALPSKVIVVALKAKHCN